jgi:hypothetical protein
VTNPVISVDLELAAKRQGGELSKLSDVEFKTARKRYEKFLALAKKSPGMRLAPTKDIDEMWHLHILSPKKYYSDCMSYFGEIFDHNGGFGKIDDEVEEWRGYCAETSVRSKEEYQEEYFAPTSYPQLDELIRSAACHGNGIAEPLGKNTPSEKA